MLLPVKIVLVLQNHTALHLKILCSTFKKETYYPQSPYFQKVFSFSILLNLFIVLPSHFEEKSELEKGAVLSVMALNFFFSFLGINKNAYQNLVACYCH